VDWSSELSPAVKKLIHEGWINVNLVMVELGVRDNCCWVSCRDIRDIREHSRGAIGELKRFVDRDGSFWVNVGVNRESGGNSRLPWPDGDLMR
jgi:hypothetical protein